MGFIKHISSTCINRDDSAFPTLVKLNNGDLICGYNVGGGSEVTGGSDWSRSNDTGSTWLHEGTILPKTENPATVNSMRLSRTGDGRVIAYGQRNYPKNDETKFGTLPNEPVFCISNPDCGKWSEGRIIPHNYADTCSFEISNPIVVLADGRWLAPAALLPDKEHLGEKVIVRESADEGESWENEYTIFSDPAGKKGFFEKKIIETSPGNLLAFAWTVELGTYKDLNNHYAFSKDGGRSWSQAIATEIIGQTLNPLWLGEDHFLLIYNYRKSPQGIRLTHAKINDSGCKIIKEDYLWQPSIPPRVKNGSKNGIDEFDDFAFGLPSVHHLSDNIYLAVFWHKEEGISGIRCLKFELKL